MSKDDHSFPGLFSNFLSKDGLQNLMKNEKTMNTVIALASQMGSHLINCDLFNQILDSNPNITDELITEQINLFKKDHPNCNTMIGKYLQSYQEYQTSRLITIITLI